MKSQIVLNATVGSDLLEMRASEGIATIKENFRRFCRNEGYVPYVLDVMIVFILLLLFLYPLLHGILSSFYIGGEITAANYSRLFSDRNFWNALRITFAYVFLYTVGIMFIGFATALAIDVGEEKKLPGSKIFSSFLTLPYAIPDVVGALIWLWMMNPRRGVINYLLSLFGAKGMNWLTSSDIVLISVVLVEIWRLFPMHTLIILAAFKTVPRDLYEAAELDGATTLQQFFYITLPSIANIMKFLVLLTVVWSFKRFTTIWLLTSGGPMHATETLAILIYKEAFKFFDREYASAIAVILLLIVGTLSIIYMKMSGRSETKGGTI